MSKYIKFDRTKDSEYALSDSADKDTIYFTTDNQIITNKKSYGMVTPIEPAKTISHEATGITTVNVPVGENYAGQGSVTVNVVVTPVTLTQAEYDALTVKDPNTIYLISE